jgi:hypothetical protein
MLGAALGNAETRRLRLEKDPEVSFRALLSDAGEYVIRLS